MKTNQRIDQVIDQARLTGKQDYRSMNKDFSQVVMVDRQNLRDSFARLIDQEKAELVAEQKISLRERLAERRGK